MKIAPKILLLLLLPLAIACSKNDDNNTPDPINKDPEPDPVERVTYNLVAANNSGAAGTAELIRNTDGTSTIYIELTSGPTGLHPAAVHYNSVAEGGSVAITLNACECQISETVITELDNGSAISFDQLMVFDGHINIYQGEQSLGEVIAQVNIGSNAF